MTGARAIIAMIVGDLDVCSARSAPARLRDRRPERVCLRNDFIGQAEALLMRGERNIIDRMTLNGSGDAFTTYGTICMVDSLLTGDGDTILAYAALFCLRCEIRSVGPFTWPRTPQGSHGNVFVDPTFIYVDRPLPWSITAAVPEGRKTPGVLGRLPRNGAANSPYANFPYAEFVMIDSRTDGVPPSGWGSVEEQRAFDWSNLRLWEYNTTDLQGRPIDLSQRHPAMRALRLPQDAQIISDYRRPEFGCCQANFRGLYFEPLGVHQRTEKCSKFCGGSTHRRVLWLA